MKTYKAMTLGDLIEALNKLGPDEKVIGFMPLVHSYRGYYERNAVEPDRAVYEADYMAYCLMGEIGKTMTGYKGGDYIVRSSEPLYLAEWGDTGPQLIGLEKNPQTGYYEPVAVEESW